MGYLKKLQAILMKAHGVFDAERRMCVDVGEEVMGLRTILDKFVGPWRPMTTAPKDQTILVITNSVEGLHPIISKCEWHESGGFCVDEIRSPIGWRPLK